MPKPKRNRPWWLEDDGGICPACSQTYAYQTEHRCVECDGPLCTACVEITFEVEIHCSGCASVEAAQAARA